MTEQKTGNPAVVGLAGFGMTTLILHFHNVGWCGIGPVICMGLIFGGHAQMIAGLQEIKRGNNFEYSEFTAYGAFWIGFMRVNGALAMTFTLLPIGFILLDIGHFSNPAMNTVAGYELMLCALSAWYVMAHLIYADVFGRDVLPVGKPWIS